MGLPERVMLPYSTVTDRSNISVSSGGQFTEVGPLPLHQLYDDGSIQLAVAGAEGWGTDPSGEDQPMTIARFCTAEGRRSPVEG